MVSENFNFIFSIRHRNPEFIGAINKYTSWESLDDVIFRQLQRMILVTLVLAIIFLYFKF